MPRLRAVALRIGFAALIFSALWLVPVARAADPMKLIMRFSAYRLQYLGNLSTWPQFGHGWSNRIANNLIRGAA